MAQITTALIQELREKTSAGMMDCKKALTEADGDLKKAVKVLREKGIAKAAKRSEREANEGIIKISINPEQTEAFILELNSETDFVSRNDKFSDLADQIITELKSSKIADTSKFLEKTLSSGKTVKDAVEELSGLLGEKITLKQTAIVSTDSNGILGEYIHSNNKIGVVVALKNGTGKNDLAKDISMHIAAAKPIYVSIDDIPADILNTEKEVLRNQVINEGKPEKIVDKIVEGKIRKFYEEIVLLEQNFVKDPNLKIKDLISSESKSSEKDIEISNFVRFSIGD